MVILDSCFSGRAIGDTLTGVDRAVLGELEVSGAYTLTSSPANRTTLVLTGEKHTAFTERLLTMLEAGSPTAGTMISLGDIYRRLHTRLRAEGLPVPQRFGVNNADLLGLVRNVQSGIASGDTPAAPDIARPECPPETDMAERIGRLIDTITGEDSVVRIRAGVARAVAVADPDRARRIAGRASGAAKAEILHSVVHVLADPTRWVFEVGRCAGIFGARRVRPGKCDTRR